MDFDLSEEQRLLKDSVERLVADHYDFEARKRHIAGPKGYSDEIWSRFAELGILGLPFAEEDGGFGGGGVDTMIVMEALGRGLVVEPYLATVVMGGGAVRRGGSPEQKQRVVPSIADGSLKLALAHSEPQSRYNLANVAASARRDGDGWALDGEKVFVLHGDSADLLVVSARVSGGQTDETGVGLFLVPADTAGVSRQGYATQDSMRAATIRLENVRVGADALLGGDAENGLKVIRRVYDDAVAATAAEAVGGMQRALELTVEYIKTRHQFGQPIGNFQALQHQAVDMFTATEQARSMAMYATMMAQEDDDLERARAMAATRVQIGRSGRLVGKTGVQLHGGVGVTIEFAIGHYLKRFTMIDAMFGDADHHLGILSDLGGLLPADAG
ncbi:acyl-CoA dehydrogenase family protein [Camelimonas abortus]|uniref:Acyl-CoA dehydrogenase family protein n=1 Tax=Camelimonas abortus TaxID=1017184 RepID=A0ABV7LC92_9HYPH